MKSKLGRLRVTALLCCLSLCQFSLADETAKSVSEPTAGEMAADLLIGRPAGIVTTILGTAVWIVGLPFNAAGGNVKDSARTLMLEPLKMTFWRCLGCSTSGYQQDD